MESLAALLNLNVGRMTVYTLVVADTAVGGALVTFLLWPDWFRELTTLKLLLLAIAITAPFLVFGSILTALHMDTVTKRKANNNGPHKGGEAGMTRLVPGAVWVASAGHLVMLMMFLGTIGVDSLTTKFGATADHSRSYQHVYWATQVGYFGMMAGIPAMSEAKGRAVILKRVVFGALSLLSSLAPYVVLKFG